MAHHTRRGVLAAVGLTVTAGCSQLPMSGSSSNSLRGKQVEQRSKTFTLQTDKFKSFPLSFDQKTVVMFSVVSDKLVDVLAFSPEQYDTFRSEPSGKVPIIDELSQQGTKATAQGITVAIDELILVIDNTSWGKTDPDGEVQVDLELEAFLPADGG